MALNKIDETEWQNVVVVKTPERIRKMNNRINEELSLIISKLSNLLCEIVKEQQEGFDYSLFSSRIKELEDENQKLLKELKDYEVLVSCIDLDNFNPALFQKGDDDEI